MRRTAPVSALLAVLALAAGCSPNGDGRVDADFSVPECPPGSTLSDLEDYGWDAGYLATERYYDDLIVQVQQYNVDITETDSVSFRLELDGLEEAGQLQRRGDFFELASPPLRLPIGRGPDDIQVVLGMYRLCERLPNYPAISGTLVLDRLDLRIDGEDTGDGEWIIGRVETASVALPTETDPVAMLSASFDFEPPKRPLREFK